MAIATSVAVAATSSNNGDRDNKGSSERSGDVRRGPEEHFSSLAKELGVSTERLRQAFDAVREKLELPQRPPQLPSRAELDKRCTDLTDALGSELDTTGDKVRAAVKAVLKAKIEDAVDDGRLIRERADRMIDRIDSAKCLPPFGLFAFGGPGPHGIGCAGRPGRHDRDLRDRPLELPAPPPDAVLLGPPPA
jgi:hypothetical protein